MPRAGQDLLAEAAAKHYFWKMQHNFIAEELDSSNTLGKELKRQLVNQLKEPPCIARESDELMALVITGHHSYMRLLIVEDVDKQNGISGGFMESSSKGKGRKPVIPQRVAGSKLQQRLQQATEGADSVEKDTECEPDVEGSDHLQQDTTRTTPSPSGLPGDSSYKDSNSELDRSRALPPCK